MKKPEKSLRNPVFIPKEPSTPTETNVQLKKNYSNSPKRTNSAIPATLTRLDSRLHTKNDIN